MSSECVHSIPSGQDADRLLPFQVFKQLPRLLVGTLFLLLGFSQSAGAQLTPRDFQELNERAVNENWTFTIGNNPATQRHGDELKGLVITDKDILASREKVWTPTIPKSGLPSRFDWREQVSGDRKSGV